MNPESPMLAFDLGGSWWRVGLLTGDRDVRLLLRAPAVNYRNTSKTVKELQQDLINFVIENTRKYAEACTVETVGVSLGAAMNGHTGKVYGSAPLWGEKKAPFNLSACLKERHPEIFWAVINDVSALALSLLSRSLSGRKAAVVTVSSGIAYRTIDLHTGRIPLEPTFGVQGEIGHLPCEFSIGSRKVEARCECGELSHIAAFSSGRGIAQLLRQLPEAAWLVEHEPNAGMVAEFGSAVRDGDPRADELLTAFIRPLAKILFHQAVLDPEIEHTMFSGGVIEGLGDAYVTRLLEILREERLYGISNDRYFDQRIFTSTSGADALLGAGIHARRLREEIHG